MSHFDFDGVYGGQYDDIIRRVVPGYQDLFAAAVAALAARVKPRARVLVVGAGSGSELIAFGHARPDWSITGVEPSAQMIKTAEQRLREHHLGHPRVRLLHGYTDDLPHRPVFDATTLICVMHFLPDDGSKQELLSDIAARLRPGGSLILIDVHGDPRTARFAHDMRAWMEYITYKGMTPSQRSVYEEQLAHDIHYVPETRIRELLERAGFHRIRPFYRAFLFGGWVADRR